MSALQEQAVQMIRNLSDDNTRFLIEVIQRLMPQKAYIKEGFGEDSSIQAFRRLDAARTEIVEYLPEDFDPEKELEEARAARYGSIG